MLSGWTISSASGDARLVPLYSRETSSSSTKRQHYCPAADSDRVDAIEVDAVNLNGRGC